MLYRRSKTGPYWCRFTDRDGRQIRESTGTTNKADAEQYEAKRKRELWAQAALGERRRYSWQEAVIRWLAETEHKASREDDLCHLRWLDPHLGSLMLDQITRDVLGNLLAARKAAGASNATCNRTLAVARAILNAAEQEWGWIDKAPKIRLLKEPKRRVRWLTQAEADRLIAELPEHLADMMRFSLQTGLREANVTGLEWGQIDLQRRVAWVHADQAKSGQALGVPLSAEATAIIRRQIGHHPVRVFCWQDRSGQWRPVQKANTAAWRKALMRAGIEDFRWHDLRHTWASWHVQAGTPLHVLQELGGWQSYAMVQRYAHLAPEHLAEWVEIASTNPGTGDQTPRLKSV